MVGSILQMVSVGLVIATTVVLALVLALFRRQGPDLAVTRFVLKQRSLGRALGVVFAGLLLLVFAKTAQVALGDAESLAVVEQVAELAASTLTLLGLLWLARIASVPRRAPAPVRVDLVGARD
ncbi:MAG TPA: hypothetical protein VJ397_08680 [Thermoplasmata archaeon]|nr:hypothetical protein [Thermoplasmata archaeon]